MADLGKLKGFLERHGVSSKVVNNVTGAVVIALASTVAAACSGATDADGKGTDTISSVRQSLSLSDLNGAQPKMLALSALGGTFTSISQIHGTTQYIVGWDPTGTGLAELYLLQSLEDTNPIKLSDYSMTGSGYSTTDGTVCNSNIYTVINGTLSEDGSWPATGTPNFNVLPASTPWSVQCNNGDGNLYVTATVPGGFSGAMRAPLATDGGIGAWQVLNGCSDQSVPHKDNLGFTIYGNKAVIARKISMPSGPGDLLVYDWDGTDCSGTAQDVNAALGVQANDANSQEKPYADEQGRLFYLSNGKIMFLEPSTADAATDALADADTTPPTLVEVTPVPNPTTNTTPSYTFNTSEAGTLLLGGGCTTSTTNVNAGDVTVTFDQMALGQHTCTISEKDAAGNTSNTLTLNFTIDAPAQDAGVNDANDGSTGVEAGDAGAQQDAPGEATSGDADAAVVNPLTIVSGPCQIDDASNLNAIKGSYSVINGGGQPCQLVYFPQNVPGVTQGTPISITKGQGSFIVGGLDAQNRTEMWISGTGGNGIGYTHTANEMPMAFVMAIQGGEVTLGTEGTVMNVDADDVTQKMTVDVPEGAVSVAVNGVPMNAINIDPQHPDWVTASHEIEIDTALGTYVGEVTKPDGGDGGVLTPDSGADAAKDAPAEAAQEAGNDGGNEGGQQEAGGPDAQQEAATDAGVDVEIDAAVPDTGSDAPVTQPQPENGGDGGGCAVAPKGVGEHQSDTGAAILALLAAAAIARKRSEEERVA